MSRTKLALIIASGLAITAPAALAEGSADGQQARDHANEVHQLKQRDQQFAEERRRQAEKDRKKLKELVEEQAEGEDSSGNDLEDDGVDGTE